MDRDLYCWYFRLEERYWWFAARRRIVVSLLDRYAGRDPDRVVLDVGSGIGVMLDPLGRYGRVTGIDCSEDVLAFCRSRGRNNVLQACGEALPFAADSVGLVCAMDVLEHIPDDRRALREWTRVLRPGGLLFLTVPAHRFLWGPHDVIHQHQRRYSRRRLLEALHSAGLAVERISYFNCFLFPPVALIRVGRWLLPGPREQARSDFAAVPGPVNRLLEGIFASERFFLSFTDLPVGVSLLCVARKP